MGVEIAGPNADQIEFWNGDAGQSWAKNQALLDAMMAPISEAVVDLAMAGPHDKVLDVGCGCGAPSLAMAEAGADVTGIDISEPMLQLARKRASEQKLKADFILADALSHSFESDHSLLFSRFGVMFFADPIAAFKNLGTAMDDAGRLCFVCWRPVIENAWVAVPMGAAAAHLPSGQPADPRAPGPFAFADRDYVTEILDSSGYKDIEITTLDKKLTIGESDNMDDIIDFYMKIGPLARVLSELEESVRSVALDAVREAVQPFIVDGRLSLDSACWLVQAQR